MQLGSFEDNEDYLRAVAERIKPQGFEVQLASYITISRDKRQYFNLQPV